jgi:signal transduction histidine kinase
MTTPIRVLIVEDSEQDAELVARSLRKAGYVPSYRRVETAEAMRAALLAAEWDAVLCDYSLPSLDGLEALEVLKETGLDLPFIIVSGTIGDDTAVAAMRAGAHDYLPKSNLARLAAAVSREVHEAGIRREQRRASAAMRDAIRARDTFLVSAAHELKTPLTRLKLHLDTAARDAERSGGSVAPRLVSRLELAGNEVASLAQLVDDMILVSRLGPTERARSPAEVDLAALVRDVASRLAPEIEAAGCSVSLRCDEAVTGTWDRAYLDAAVASLLRNAVRYGTQGPVEVAVAPDGEGARVVVLDHGIGIAPEDQARIFEQFERAVPASHYGGLGLGLWIARETVRALGGTIRVESAAGQGATFTVELPRRGPGARAAA